MTSYDPELVLPYIGAGNAKLDNLALKTGRPVLTDLQERMLKGGTLI